MIELSLHTILDFTSIVICTFLALNFLTLNRGSKVANVLMGSFLLQFSLSITMVHIETFEWVKEHIWLLYLPIISPFAPAVLLFYYMLELTNQRKQYGKRYGWICIPVVMEVLGRMVLTVSSILSNDQHFEFYMNFQFWTNYASLPFSFVVLLLLLFRLKAHHANLYDLYSDVTNKTMKWLRSIGLIMLGFNAIWLVDDTIRVSIGDHTLSMLIAESSDLATFFTVLWIGFKGIRQPAIFDVTSVQMEPRMIVVESKLEPTELGTNKQLYSRLLGVMEENKMFLDVDLSLRQIADELQTTDKKVSKAINDNYGSNFYSFVNGFRVNEFKRSLKHGPQNLSLIGHAFESGFKSKTTFYAAFKKIEGITPKDFENRFKNSSPASN